MQINAKPSVCDGPANVLFTRNYQVYFDDQMTEIIESSVKKIFIKHALTWLSLENLSVAVFSDLPPITKQYVQRIRVQTIDRDRLLWVKNIGLRDFFRIEPQFSPCLHKGSALFWKTASNHNRTCERFIGRMADILEQGLIKDSPDIDTKAHGYLCMALKGT